MHGQTRSLEMSVLPIDSAKVERIGKRVRRHRRARTSVVATGVSAGTLALGGGLALIQMGHDPTADPIAPLPTTSPSNLREPVLGGLFAEHIGGTESCRDDGSGLCSSSATRR